VAWGSAKRREAAELALDNPGVASCGVCGRRWERPSLRWALREFEEHDCPAGEVARIRQAAKTAEREIACEAAAGSPSQRNTVAQLFSQSIARSVRTNADTSEPPA
jgi:hypothetical protein